MTERSTSCSRSPLSKRRRGQDKPMLSRTAASALAMFFVAQRASQGFSPSSHPSTRAAPPQSSVRRRFRQSDDADSAVAFLTYPLTTSSQPAAASILSELMPTWLRYPRDHLFEANVAALKEAMMSAYLSESEVALVLSAIEDAAEGDVGKAAGAAEFCQILVDTMEMDVTTLVAGAFHYCACVTARERYASVPPAQFSLSTFWDGHVSEGQVGAVDMYGSEVAAVARDAARLKRTEAVAASVAGSSPDDADWSANLRGLLLSETRDWRALAIRSAACLYRLRGLHRARGDGGVGSVEVGRTTSEEVRASRDALLIYAPLASRVGMHRLKNELEGAAFKLKYRRQYRKVMNLSLEKGQEDGTLRDGLQSVLDEVTARVTDVLNKDPTFRKYADRVVVSARVKEPFSLWRKMLKTGAKHILDVPDAIALRVVLRGKKLVSEEEDEVTRARERALCYYVQKMCIDRFQPLPGRFKDYIERPKRNGYQSLHYTARANWGGQEWPFEVQIRSEEMHRVAEYGLASHWNYKDFAKQNASTRDSYRQDESLEAYLKFVQEWQWQQSQGGVLGGVSGDILTQPRQLIATVAPPSVLDNGMSREEHLRARAERIAPYIEALSAAKSDLARGSVFVFLSSPGQKQSGKVLALPSGACVIDALREGERKFGVSVDWRNKSRGARVEHNGVESNTTERLHNGDVVMVQSSLQPLLV